MTATSIELRHKLQDMSKVIFPRSFAVAIDDMGWINGRNDGYKGYGPYRLGLKRDMEVKDYEAVVDLGRKAGVRLQGLFILGEYDKENKLHQVPTATHLRGHRQSDEHRGKGQDEIMEYVKANSTYLEFGLHGIGHEFWPENGVRKRAEWYNTEDDHPWPEEEIRAHVNCLVDIMAQYGISRSNGHSFPESFVPCAYSFYWNPGGAYSLGSVLGEYGVKYANTDFTMIPELNPPVDGGFDHEVHVLNRFNYGNLWHEIGKTPSIPLEYQNTDYVEVHWPNLLAQDDFLQEEVTSSWARYFLEVQKNTNRYCAKNTSQHHSQWLYKKYTKVEEESPGLVKIDNTRMPEDAYRGEFPGNLVLKIPLHEGEHVSSAYLNGLPVPAYYEAAGFGFLYLPQLLGQRYELSYGLGSEMIQNTAWHDGTSNIFEITIEEESTKINLCLYGQLKLKFLTRTEPSAVISNSPGIEIMDWKWIGTGIEMELKARNIQGETGSIEVRH